MERSEMFFDTNVQLLKYRVLKSVVEHYDRGTLGVKDKADTYGIICPYTYADGYLATVANFEGDVYVENTYDDMGRVIHQYAANIGTFDFSYDFDARHNICTGTDGYLLEICACPGITQEQLSRRIYANKSNVARQLAVLEETGYVLRQPGEADRRVMRVYPTEKALAALPRIQAIMDGWESVVAAGLSEEERGRLTALLEEMTRRAAALVEERQDGKAE